MAIEALATHLVRAITRSPDDVKISVDELGDGLMVHVSVADEDRGAVIGRQGRTIRAIEAVLQAAERTGRPVAIDLAD
jgi:predicted RNA-binding protein YlqC (UPF0109 family)